MTRTALLAALLALSACDGEATREDAAEADTVVVTEVREPGAVHRGELAEGDSTLASGEFADEVRFSARRGQPITVSLSSKEDLDTYLILRSPTSVQRENDDAGDNTRSRIFTVADTSGTWRAIVTSYEAGQTGPYTLRVFVEDRVPDMPHTESGL